MGDKNGGGARARKRGETLARIRDAGIALFIARGYDATTLDDIAAAAGISRRTFFYYFPSKDAILLSLQADVGDLIVGAVRGAPATGRPFETVRGAIVKVCAAIPTDDMIAIDRLMRSSPAVQARKQASYVRYEEMLFTALSERWPERERRTGLRLLAMLAIGAMRHAADAFFAEGGRRPFVDLLLEAFGALKAEL